ncbi:tetratricopeptide repeat protein 29-like [Acanthaster planci]|uniref:Tetratricopeptide repeat protein 29 n=1 Tax=Acanthaster planci TaxID=133434 RepID=A0A8B7ZUP8_ACAPL|nr:tetratricopeptide repeat protein 29-like [Acanthaster planci]XP_022108505.1 tetratricopeptide repeat protein 29-like [Acanthaster planci]XP_022108506.1 tetratricopeptide repeat protein 29-like [Acanthaster planci]
MAAPLPAIHNTRGHSPIHDQAIPQHRVPSPPSQSRPQDQYVKPKLKGQGRREREHVMKQYLLTNKKPSLTKLDTQKYRNTFFHNLCLEMLKDGFHRSFSEVFALVQQQKAEINAAGPDSLLQDRRLLAEQEVKLEEMKKRLTEAELALRIDDIDGVFTARNHLAEYFLDTGDLWLSDHFFISCLEMAQKIKGDGRRKEGEAHCNMGRAYERRKEYREAAVHFEAFDDLTSKNPDWKNAEGQSLHSEACEHLRRLYTTIAEIYQQGEGKDPQEAIANLLKAFEKAKESGDGQKEGEASYRLGLAYESIGDSETALMYHTGFMDICKKVGDQDGMGKACEAIAKAYEKQGKLDEAVRYLEMFEDIAEKSDQLAAHGKACSCLGEIYNSLGKYKKASHYFGKAFNIARSMDKPPFFEAMRAEFGIANAHGALRRFMGLIERPDKTKMLELIDWKDVRNDQMAEEEDEPSK